ncbi:MAG: hypothetical protein AAFW81_12700 [Pseudomonadota bacterium]
MAEHDLLADAARQVENVEWPKPEPASLMTMITGGGGDRFTRDDAVNYYLNALGDAPSRFQNLRADADATLEAAAQLRDVAYLTAGAARVSMNDVALVETAIQTLRDHREIYAAAARQLEDDGGLVANADIDALRDQFTGAIRALSAAADRLAERVETDRSSTLAAPSPSIARSLPDL